MNHIHILRDVAASVAAAVLSYGLYRATESALWSMALLAAMTGAFVWWVCDKE